MDDAFRQGSDFQLRSISRPVRVEQLKPGVDSPRIQVGFPSHLFIRRSPILRRRWQQPRNVMRRPQPKRSLKRPVDFSKHRGIDGEKQGEVYQVLDSRVGTIRPGSRVGVNLLSKMLGLRNRHRMSRSDVRKAKEVLPHEIIRSGRRRIPKTNIEMKLGEGAAREDGVDRKPSAAIRRPLQFGTRLTNLE